MSWPAEAVMVRVPATSANLGPGFDALGLALALHDELEVRATRGGLSVEVSGVGADTAAAGEGHLIVRAMRAAFAAAGSQPPGLALRCVNRIPHGRGLGSSAAAIVAGVVAARALLAGRGAPGAAEPGAGEPGDEKPGLTDAEVYALAAEIEGHPDNVAACLVGGLTIAWLEDGGPRLVRLSPLPEIKPVVCISPNALATAQARKVLPETVRHADAATNVGRSALLVAALTAAPAVLLAATQDLLHQPYRAPVMPDTAGLVNRLRGAGIPAVVSGAGPSVLAFPAAESSAGLGVLGSIVKETGNGWLVSPLDVDRQGASVQSGPPDATSSNAPRKAWPGRGLGQERPGSAASPEPQDRPSSSATHGQLSREYRGLSWC
ncbi:MAG TPA: homoserine kinase [Streptosporangiaceae bacterium]|nr:homoserine kinase [Streptosporangiaceae bacterium]